MAPVDSFAQLMAQLQAGQDEAAQKVFQRFAQQLIQLARRQIHCLLGGKVEPEDVVQSACKSFFLSFREGKLVVRDWNSLWGLLTLMTLRKCADRAEYFRAERRDAAREVAGPPAGSCWEPIDREPSPVDAAILAETVEQLLTGLDEDERPVIELSLQGYTVQEISQQLGRAERTVRRLRERVKKRLERMQTRAS